MVITWLRWCLHCIVTDFPSVINLSPMGSFSERILLLRLQLTDVSIHGGCSSSYYCGILMVIFLLSSINQNYHLLIKILL